MTSTPEYSLWSLIVGLLGIIVGRCWEGLEFRVEGLGFKV